MENSCPNTPTFNIGLFEDIIPSIPDFSPSGDEALTRIDEELTRIDEDEECISVDEPKQNLPFLSKRFVRTTDTERDYILNNKDSDNTKKSTNYAVKAFKTWGNWTGSKFLKSATASDQPVP